MAPCRKRSGKSWYTSFRRIPSAGSLSRRTPAARAQLQAANTVINVDLFWNPAVLEQRIGRASHGSKATSASYVLVTEETIEENLDTLNDLALAALDSESQVDTVEMAAAPKIRPARDRAAKPGVIDETGPRRTAARCKLSSASQGAGGVLLPRSGLALIPAEQHCCSPKLSKIYARGLPLLPSPTKPADQG
jgi:hypothetical protein